MRAEEEQVDFANWLLELGDGKLDCEESVQIPNSIRIPPQCTIIPDDMVSAIVTDFSDPEAITDSVILTPTNEYSLLMNQSVINTMPGDRKVYTNADRAICDDQTEADNYPMEFINSLTPSGMPPHSLCLKTGAIVMLLRNLDIRKGLCNGTRLVIRNLHERVIDAKILTGANKGDLVLIPRLKLAPSDVNLPFTLERTQFPLRLSYCMTINKSQGQTFSRLGIFLPSPVFAHGQLYVAFSRARKYQDICVKVSATNTQGMCRANTITQNVVYKEVL